MTETGIGPEIAKKGKQERMKEKRNESKNGG